MITLNFLQCGNFLFEDNKALDMSRYRPRYSPAGISVIGNTYTDICIGA